MTSPVNHLAVRLQPDGPNSPKSEVRWVTGGVHPCPTATVGLPSNVQMLLHQAAIHPQVWQGVGRGVSKGVSVLQHHARAAIAGPARHKTTAGPLSRIEGGGHKTEPFHTLGKQRVTSKAVICGKTAAGFPQISDQQICGSGICSFPTGFLQNLQIRGRKSADSRFRRLVTGDAGLFENATRKSA